MIYAPLTLDPPDFLCLLGMDGVPAAHTHGPWRGVVHRVGYVVGFFCWVLLGRVVVPLAIGHGWLLVLTHGLVCDYGLHALCCRMPWGVASANACL